MALPSLPVGCTRKAWRCVAKQRNVHLVECACERNPMEWEQWVLLTGDRHLDNPHSDWEMQERHLAEARKRGAFILDVGDLFCAMGGKWDPRRSKHGVTRPEHALADDYLDSIVRGNATLLKPYAALFAVIAKGNHETAMTKQHETDLTERLCERISTPTHRVHAGGYGGWVVVNLTYKGARTGFKIKYYHGTGGGAMMSFGTLDVRRRLSYTPDADLIVSGHNHNEWVVRVARERLRTTSGVYEVKQDDVVFINTPSYKNEYADGAGGWAVEKGHPPKPLGAMWLRLFVMYGGGERIQRNKHNQGFRLGCECTPAH